MTCDLTDMEIQILYILYRNKNFKSNANYHREKLKKILRKKFDQDFDEAIATLKNQAYIATIKKDDLKYYILDLGKAYSVMKNHGLNVSPLGGGRVHHLD
jgi:exonuclease I